jgi:hypothetical protein
LSDANSSTTDLSCPGCGYDLRGSFDGAQTFACPECGGATNIEQLAQRVVREAAARRRAWSSLVFAIAAVGVLLFLVGGLQASGSDSEYVVLSVTASVVAWFSSHDYAITRKTRIAFCVTPVVLLLLMLLFGASKLITMACVVAWVGWQCVDRVLIAVRAIRGPFK